MEYDLSDVIRVEEDGPVRIVTPAFLVSSFGLVWPDLCRSRSLARWAGRCGGLMHPDCQSGYPRQSG